MKNIKNFSNFINEGFLDNDIFSRFGSIISKTPSTAYTQGINEIPPGSEIISPDSISSSTFSTSRNDESSCTGNDCWTFFGKEKFWNGVNKINNKTVPKITIDKSKDHFNINYEGASSGFLLKHKNGGKGDTIHQLLNVLTLELNSYLETIYAKPVLSKIKMDLRGNKLSVNVPLQSSTKHYEIHRRGGLGHGGDFSGLVKYENNPGYEEAIHKTGRLTEKFIIFEK